MARITAPKIAYRLERTEDPGSDAGFHLKVMEGEDMVLMSCGAMGRREEVVQAPIALIQTEDTCQTCFASLFSAGTKNSAQGVGMTVVLPEKAVKLCNAEGEADGCEYHLFTISGEEGLVTSCGLMGSEEETEYVPLDEVPSSELCAGCFGPFRIEDELAPFAAAEASAAPVTGFSEEFTEFPSLDELITSFEIPEEQEALPAIQEEVEVTSPAREQAAAMAVSEPVQEPVAASSKISPAHPESLAESLGFGSIDDLFDQIVDDATSQETARAAETAAHAQSVSPEPEAEVLQPAAPPRLEDFIAKPAETSPIAPKPVTAATPAAPAAPQQPPPVREQSKSRSSLVWVVVAALALAGGAGYYFTSQKPEAAPAAFAESAPKKSVSADSPGPSAEERKALADLKEREEAESKAAGEKSARAEALRAEAERAEKMAGEKALEAEKARKTAETVKPQKNKDDLLAAQKAKAEADEEERISREAAARARAEAKEAQARAAAEEEARRVRQAAEEKARVEAESAARAKAEAEAAAKAKAEAEAAAVAPKTAPKASEAPYLIHFNDKNLERCVRAAAKVPEGARLTEDLFRDLRVLDCQGSAIESVAGIESLLTLESVNLSNNGIVDMTPLAFLPRLVSLNLKFNKITDISSITRIPSKCEINLLDNPIADIKPLLKRRKK
ncbi:hypothetical protein EPN96_08880 [bacterium]|nr:MAG: hypothetical protein EPN96_08880 [bacterium]